MLRKRECAVVAALFLAAVFATGRARLVLDDIVSAFRNDFQAMTYLPRGDALKVVSAGFDAPMADALFIKALVYYPQTAEQTKYKDMSRLFIFELFDVVTDLSPRFYRAYEMGALFLTASASLDLNQKGIRLLQKGVDVYDRLEAEGKASTVDVDPRWLFHSLMATTQEVSIQSRLKESGDSEGASEARLEAGRQFRLAAASPGAPLYIIDAARGFESVLKGQGDIEAGRAAVLSVLTEAHNQAAQRGDEDLAADLEKRVTEARKELEAIVVTRQLQALLSQAGGRFLQARGRPAESVEELYKAGLLNGVPSGWPLDELDPEAEKDEMLALPDGTFRSRALAMRETQAHLELFLDSVILYRRFNDNSLPPDMASLVEAGVLAALPQPPLAGKGQKYVYNEKTGETVSTPFNLFDDSVEYGPMPPPPAEPE